jgi:TfoX/Sxy family transcriptional regulator of competence genes
MAYDKGLFERLELICENLPPLAPKKMFGGICWLYEGNICFGILNDFLILRVGQDMGATLLQKPHIKPMDITGKIMKGWVMIAPDGYEDDRELNEYTQMAINFGSTLPPKIG